MEGCAVRHSPAAQAEAVYDICGVPCGGGRVEVGVLIDFTPFRIEFSLGFLRAYRFVPDRSAVRVIILLFREGQGSNGAETGKAHVTSPTLEKPGMWR